jgi:hypothetical protein
MLISLGLALLGQSTMVTAQQSGSGIRVFPNTGSLSNFPGTSWRYNGELLPWGPNPNLDFIPTVKDESAVMNVQNVIDSWMNTPEINQVFSLETRQYCLLEARMGLAADPIAWQSGMSAAKGAELQKKISSEIKGRGMGMFQLGFPTVEVKHGTIDPTGYEWLEVSQFYLLVSRSEMSDNEQEMRDLCQSDCLTDFLVVNYEGDHAADMAAELEVGPESI